MLKRWVKDLCYLIKWNQPTGRSPTEYECTTGLEEQTKHQKKEKLEKSLLTVIKCRASLASCEF